MKGFRTFEFDLPAALLVHLVALIDGMDSAPLTDAGTEDIPSKKVDQGVYVLIHKSTIVYVGKTDGKSGLRGRLRRHVKRIQHRAGLEPSAVQFKAIRIYVFTAIDLESQVRGHYDAPEWNNSGFGSNDPGRRRDKTKLKADGFDDSFPIDIDRPLGLSLEISDSAQRALVRLRGLLPYTLRWEAAEGKGRPPHSDLSQTNVTLKLKQDTSARMVIESLVGQLPAGWQATRLAGRLILYKEREDYEYGMVVARS